MAEKLDSFPSLASSGPSSLGSEGYASFGEEDPVFVNDSDRDRFMCPVHKGVLRNVRQTDCGHRLCARCVQDWIGESSSRLCPVGDSDCVEITVATVLPDRSIEREMRDVLVVCKNKAQGCTKRLKLKDWKNHLATCPYEQLSCRYSSRGCKDMVPRKDLDTHGKKCPYRPEKCPQCGEEVNFNEMKKHVSEMCMENTVNCPYGCSKTLKRKEIDDHRQHCPAQPRKCKFEHIGCEFMDKKEVVEKHEKDELPFHLELISKWALNTEGKVNEAQVRLRNLSAEHDQLAQRMLSSSDGENTLFKQQEATIKDLKLTFVRAMEKFISMERRLGNMADRPQMEAIEQSVTTLTQRISQLEQMRVQEQRQQSGTPGGRATAAASVGALGGALGAVGGALGGLGAVTGAVLSAGVYGTLENMADAVSTQLTAHDHQLGVHDVRMAEMDLRFQLLETASYDGTLVWKIRDYDRRKRDAINGRTLSLYSQPFYSSRFGYKMCARVYLNGDGMGKATHLSLFFVVMRGEYDALLVWPFRQKVTMTLLDQSPEKRHLTDNFQPDPNSSSFQRPVSEMNVASGCPLFVSHTVLENTVNGYLKDNTVFIRIIVDSVSSSAS